MGRELHPTRVLFQLPGRVVVVRVLLAGLPPVGGARCGLHGASGAGSLSRIGSRSFASGLLCVTRGAFAAKTNLRASRAMA